MDLSGKVAFVTGGSGDIGGAIARGLAKVGVDVAVSFVGDAQRASATVDAVHEFGQRSLAVRLINVIRMRSMRASGKSLLGSVASTSSSTTRHGISAFLLAI